MGADEQKSSRNIDEEAHTLEGLLHFCGGGNLLLKRGRRGDAGR